MKEKFTKYKHANVLRALLLVVAAGSLFVLYSNYLGEYEPIIEVLRGSALVLIAFVFIFMVFNLHLAIGMADLKGRKVLDHLVLFTFLFYIITHSIPLISELSDGSINEIADSAGLSINNLILNHVAVVIFVPCIILFTIIWSIRRIKVADASKDRKSINRYTVLYFLCVLLSLLALIYAVATPLYTL